MRQSSIKIIILLQVFLYLLGGHATAHGLAWCLSADGHAHVAISADCVPGLEGQKEFSCGATSHTGVECRHLPVTSPHATSVVSAQIVESASVVTVITAVFDPTLRRLTAAVNLQIPFTTSVELPRNLALVALRAIVLII
jgi:hypothetical protein